eukprot:5132708-Pleurochrysis_carterae.AAC.2
MGSGMTGTALLVMGGGVEFASRAQVVCRRKRRQPRASGLNPAKLVGTLHSANSAILLPDKWAIASLEGGDGRGALTSLSPLISICVASARVVTPLNSLVTRARMAASATRRLTRLAAARPAHAPMMSDVSSRLVSRSRSSESVAKGTAMAELGQKAFKSLAQQMSPVATPTHAAAKRRMRHTSCNHHLRPSTPL